MMFERKTLQKPQKSPLVFFKKSLDFFTRRFGSKLLTLGIWIPATASCHERHLILEHRQGYSMTLMCTAGFLATCLLVESLLVNTEGICFRSHVFCWSQKAKLGDKSRGHILPTLDGKAGGAEQMLGCWVLGTGVQDVDRRIGWWYDGLFHPT